MNILEAIQANPVFSSLDENFIKQIVNSRSISETAVYESVSERNFDLISADLYHHCALFSDFKEGQMSVKMNTSLMLKKAESIYRLYADPKLCEFETKPVETKGPTKINVGINFS